MPHSFSYAVSMNLEHSIKEGSHERYPDHFQCFRNIKKIKYPDFQAMTVERCEIRIGSFTSCRWSGLLPSCGRLVRISFPSLLEIDEFCGFPAFSLLFWHERFLLCQILRLQVDLGKENN